MVNLFGTRELDGTELRTLQLNEVWPTEEQLWLAGSLKSQGGMSVAGAFVASAAMVNSATLVHCDSEFRRFSTDVPQLDLPLPQANAKTTHR